MDKRIQEAVELFTDVMIYGTERVIKTVNHPLWNEYSPEQMQMLKLISKENRITSSRLALLQGVNKSAISNRLKKLLQDGLVQIAESTDKRQKLLEITADGEKALEQSNLALASYIEKLMLEQVDDEEIDQFLRIFRKLKKIMKTEEV